MWISYLPLPLLGGFRQYLKHKPQDDTGMIPVSCWTQSEVYLTHRFRSWLYSSSSSYYYLFIIWKL